MKKIISALILLTAVANVKAQTPASTGYEIKITVKDIKDSVCYLTRYKWEGQYFVDTAKVKKGVFTFKGKQPLEKGLYSILRANKSYIYFDLPITEQQKFSIVTDTLDMYKNMKVTGSPINEDFRQFVVVMSSNYKEAYDFEQDVKKRKDPDSTKLIRENKTKHYEEIKKIPERLFI